MSGSLLYVNYILLASTYSMIVANFVRNAKPVSSDDISQLFANINDETSYKIESELIKKKNTSVLCWVETINTIQYRNGTRTRDREFSIILESPAKLNRSALESDSTLNLNDDTRRSKMLNFTTSNHSKNFTVHVNKSIICGSGPIITKEYIKWKGIRDRVQLNVGSERMLETFESDSKINNLKNMFLNNSKFEIDHPNKTGGERSMNDIFEKLMNNPHNKRYNRSAHDRDFSNDENDSKSSIMESFEDSVESLESPKKPVHTGNMRLEKNVNYQECNLVHKIGVKIQIIIEHKVIDVDSNTTLQVIPIGSAVKHQDFEMKMTTRPRINDSEQINKSWNRLARLLMKDFSASSNDRVISFSRMASEKMDSHHQINSQENNGEIIYDEKALEDVHDLYQETNKRKSKKKTM